MATNIMGAYSGTSRTFSPQTSRPNIRKRGGAIAPRRRCISRKTTGAWPCFSVEMCASCCSTIEKPSLKYQEIARALYSTTLRRRSELAGPFPRDARSSSKSSLATPRLLWPGKTTTWLIFVCGPSSWPGFAALTLLASMSLRNSVSPTGLKRTSMLPGLAMQNCAMPLRLPSVLDTIFASSHLPCPDRTPEPELAPDAKTPSTRSWPSSAWVIWWESEGSALQDQLPTYCGRSAASVQEM
mmetsp:Transcript_45976/g.133210  ORF Transcript_45976/g.133210 Transcript_45976/m.133210 type:complete len:241 (-) Transcript_45976:734-1456(-)